MPNHVQDQRRQFLRRLPHRPDDQARDPAHHHRGRRGALQRRCSARASRCSRRTRSRVRSAIRARRSTTSWCFTWCSARPCRTSRSMPSPISAMPTAGSWRRSIPATRINAVSEVIGLKENSSRKTGIVFVRSTGCNQDGSKVLEYVRWVMVRKRDEAAPAAAITCRDCLMRCCRARWAMPVRASTSAAYDFTLAGSPYRFADYAVGEKIDHVDGMTVEEAEHQIATRLYQNTARIHFNQFAAAQGPVRPPADLWRARDLAGARALLQRARQCLSYRRHQRRASRVAAVCRHHRVRVVGGAGEGRRAGARRRRRAAAAHRRGQGSALQRLSPQVRRARTSRPSCSISIIGR